MFSSHILQDAELICDRVAVLNQGRLAAAGPLNELLSGHVRQWEVVTEGGDTRQIESLAPHIKQTRETAIGRMRIVEAQEHADEIVRRTLGSGGRVVSVTPHRQTLEEYFIEEMKGERAA
jgi:ABC-2 type transport system ATP-binding protein